jgi:hypothetical protein
MLLAAESEGTALNYGNLELDSNGQCGAARMEELEFDI